MAFQANILERQRPYGCYCRQVERTVSPLIGEIDMRVNDLSEKQLQFLRKNENKKIVAVILVLGICTVSGMQKDFGPLGIITALVLLTLGTYALAKRSSNILKPMERERARFLIDEYIKKDQEANEVTLLSYVNSEWKKFEEVRCSECYPEHDVYDADID